MKLKSLEHVNKLKSELAGLKQKLRDMELKTGLLESHMSDVLADETSTAQQIAQARGALPEHVNSMDALRREITAYEAAIPAVRSAAHLDAQMEFVEAVKAHCQTMPERWRGFREHAEALISIAENVAAGWREYRAFYEAWGQCGFGTSPPPVPGRPDRDMQQYANSLCQVAEILRKLLRLC